VCPDSRSSKSGSPTGSKAYHDCGIKGVRLLQRGYIWRMNLIQMVRFNAPYALNFRHDNRKTTMLIQSKNKIMPGCLSALIGVEVT
jgi:hypothetical protein